MNRRNDRYRFIRFAPFGRGHRPVTATSRVLRRIRGGVAAGSVFLVVALFLVFASKFGASGAFWHMIAAAGCDAARAAGVAPAYRGHPGYHARNDRDGDGIACEPYYGRTRMGGPVT